MKKLAFFLFAVIVFVACNSATNNKAETTVEEPAQIVETTFNIGGMHCDMCVASIEKGISGLEGIKSVVVSLNDSNAVVKYSSKLDKAEIEKAIEKRGYSIKN